MKPSDDFWGRSIVERPGDSALFFQAGVNIYYQENKVPMLDYFYKKI